MSLYNPCASRFEAMEIIEVAIPEEQSADLADPVTQRERLPTRETPKPLPTWSLNVLNSSHLGHCTPFRPFWQLAVLDRLGFDRGEIHKFRRTAMQVTASSFRQTVSEMLKGLRL